MCVYARGGPAALAKERAKDEYVPGRSGMRVVAGGERGSKVNATDAKTRQRSMGKRTNGCSGVGLTQKNLMIVKTGRQGA